MTRCADLHSYLQKQDFSSNTSACSRRNTTSCVMLSMDRWPMSLSLAVEACRKDGVFESGFSDFLAQQIEAASDDAARYISFVLHKTSLQ